MPDRTNVQVQRIRAIALTVTDAARSKDFYTQALAFELISDITVENPDYSDLEGSIPLLQERHQTDKRSLR